MHLQQMLALRNDDGGPDAYTAPTVMLLKILEFVLPSKVVTLVYFRNL